MNFRTTLILIALLAIGGLVVFLTRDKTGDDAASKAKDATVVSAASGAKIVDVDNASITQVSIAPADDKPIVMKRQGMIWTLQQPVQAPADPAIVARVTEALTALKSKGTLPAGPNASATGLDHPRFKIELIDKDGKSTKLNIGDRAATGNNLYVEKNGASEIDLVDADVLTDLNQGATAFRRAKIFDTAAPAVREVTINSTKPATTQPTSMPASSQTLVLRKLATDWQIVEPAAMPAESSAVSDLLFSIVDVKAEEFIAETVDDARKRGLDEPQLAVTFSTAVSTTQATSQPATDAASKSMTIKFGNFTDVTKKHVYATASNSPALFTVAASSLDAFRKQAIDLRDKRVVTIPADRISHINLVMDQTATTRPTTREASHSVMEIERAPKIATSEPATSPSTTQASTKPSTRSAATWQIVRTIAEPSPAIDATVDALLQQLNPLRVDRYIEGSAATTQPAGAKTIEMKIDTVANGGASDSYTITLTDSGSNQPIVGQYGDAKFEVSRSLFDAALADFSKPPAAPMTGGSFPANVNPE